MTNDPYRVSVIIPTIKRSSLSDTEAALRTQTRVPHEIIVIEDRDRRGPSWARNEGIRKASGNVIALIDDDCIPETDWLERFITALEEHSASMVSSHYREADPFLHEIRQRRAFPKSTQINPDGFVGISGNVMYRRECLEECLRLDGFIFNPVFGIHASEDKELVWRLRKRGHKLVFIANEVRHLKRMTPATYLKHQFNRGIGIAILDQIQKKAAGEDVPDIGLLWQKGKEKSPAMKWTSIILNNLIGPFDHKSFSSLTYFITFWLGEKAKSLGFIYYLANSRFNSNHELNPGSGS